MTTVWPWKRSTVSKTQAVAEDAIADSLSGGDSLPAWNAIWDLVQSRDTQGKQEILDDLRSYVADSIASDSVEQARSFEQALDVSRRRRVLGGSTTADGVVHHSRPVPPSKEVREQNAQDQIKRHRDAMHDIGVRPGDGIPMWALYMTRRNKRSWG